MRNCRARGRARRRSLGFLKTDVAWTDQVAGRSSVAAFEMVAVKEGTVGVCDALLQTYLGRPAQSAKLVDAQEFAWRAIWLGEVTRDLAVETNDLGDEMCQFEDGNVFAATDVHMTFGGIGLHEMEAGVGAIVNMQEFAPRRAGTPDHHLLRACQLRFMEAADQGGDDVAELGMIIVAGAVDWSASR